MRKLNMPTRISVKVTLALWVSVLRHTCLLAGQEVIISRAAARLDQSNFVAFSDRKSSLASDPSPITFNRSRRHPGC